MADETNISNFPKTAPLTGKLGNSYTGRSVEASLMNSVQLGNTVPLTPQQQDEMSRSI